ncbi:MAG: hypothetical protein Q4C84_11710 [Bacillota bacterium]|nr:hypothetical protein [Bacillota bacterium]
MKKKLILAIVASFALSITACGNDTSELDSLKKENEELKAQIEQLQEELNGQTQEEDNAYLAAALANASEEGERRAAESKVYGIGETWTVDGLWSLTFTSVNQTDDRNKYSDKTPEQVVLLNYDYENIGYKGTSQDLYISGVSFQVIDGNGEIADSYPGRVTNHPQELPVGAKCTGAQECIGLNNTSEKIKVIVSLYDNNHEEHTATFELPVE